MTKTFTHTHTICWLTGQVRQVKDQGKGTLPKQYKRSISILLAYYKISINFAFLEAKQLTILKLIKYQNMIQFNHLFFSITFSLSTVSSEI